MPIVLVYNLIYLNLQFIFKTAESIQPVGRDSDCRIETELNATLAVDFFQMPGD